MRLKIPLAGALAFATACAGPDAPATVTLPTDAATAAGPEDSLHEVARALAMGLRDPAARVQVRNAMRRSLLSEHKLVLQEYVETAGGKALLRAASAAAGTTPEALRERIATLPPLDFYAPFREHRLTWRGTPDVLVGGTLDQDDSALTAFDAAGRPARLDARAGAPATALMILHPAERKGLRARPQTDLPGEVIQEPGDGEISALLSTCSPTAVETCDPSYEVGGSGPVSADTTFLDRFKIDYKDGWGSAELEFRAKLHRGGTAVDSRTLRVENVLTDVDYFLHLPLLYREITAGSTDFIRVHVVETDWLDDDDRGTRDFFEADRARWLAIHAGMGFVDPDTWVGENTYVELDWQP